MMQSQWLDKTRQDKTRQNKTRQDKTRQNKTRQDKTRQNKTRQDKTRQDAEIRLGCLTGFGGGNFAGQVFDKDGLSPTLTDMQGGSVIELGDPDFYNFLYEIDGEIYLIRIRKLMPLECWRLMNFTDEDFHKAEEVVSNTQLYKQAGNSIVKSVLMALFSQLGISGVKKWNDMTEEERYKVIK